MARKTLTKKRTKIEWPILDEHTGKLDLRTALRDPKTGAIVAVRNHVRECKDGEFVLYRFIDGEFAGQVYTEEGTRHEKYEQNEKVETNVKTERPNSKVSVQGNL